MKKTIQSKIVKWEEIQNIRNSIQDQTLVFTNGCFDIIHRGHVEYLSEARNLGDVLWVGLNSDDSVRRLKGESRPIYSEEDRAIVLASLESVDFVTIFPDDTPIALIQILKPSIHTKGGDYIPDNLPEKALVESFGGRVVILPFLEGRSTSTTLKKLERP